MRNTIERFDPTPEFIKINGIDQQKAEGCWRKLEGKADEIIRHPKHVFFAIMGDEPELINRDFFEIGIYPPNTSIETDYEKELFRIFFVKESNKKFITMQSSIDLGEKTPLTAADINTLFEQIINGTLENEKTPNETEKIIRETRKLIK